MGRSIPHVPHTFASQDARAQLDPPPIGFSVYLRYNIRMIRHNLVTMSTTTPTELSIEDKINGACTLVVENVDATAYVYLGNEGVTSSNYGFLLYPQQAFTIELRPSDKIYAIGNSASIVACMSIERAT